jgi:hypothetical protein
LKGSRLSRAIGISICLLALIGFAAPLWAEENFFEYGDFSLSLPEGWVERDIPAGSEKELVGSLGSEHIRGTSVLLFCYKGGGYNHSSVRINALKVIASVSPKGQEMVKERTKVKTEGGLTAVVELWRGLADTGGTAVSLRVPMGIIETKVGWIMMLGFTPEATGAQLEEAFLRMIQSAGYKSASFAPSDLQNQDI